MTRPVLRCSSTITDTTLACFTILLVHICLKLYMIPTITTNTNMICLHTPFLFYYDSPPIFPYILLAWSDFFITNPVFSDSEAFMENSTSSVETCIDPVNIPWVLCGWRDHTSKLCPLRHDEPTRFLLDALDLPAAIMRQHSVHSLTMPP